MLLGESYDLFSSSVFNYPFTFWTCRDSLLKCVNLKNLELWVDIVLYVRKGHLYLVSVYRYVIKYFILSCFISFLSQFDIDIKHSFSMDLLCVHKHLSFFLMSFFPVPCFFFSDSCNHLDNLNYYNFVFTVWNPYFNCVMNLPLNIQFFTHNSLLFHI